MYVAINGKGNARSVYIMKSYRKNDGKTSSSVYKKLGKLNDLLSKFDNDLDKLMVWAKEEAQKETEINNSENDKIVIPFNPNNRVERDVDNCFNVGYLFLQCIIRDLKFDNISRNITNRHKFKYSFNAILTDLIYSRILNPSSKLSSYNYAFSLLEPPKYKLEDVYRALSVLALESNYIQEELYRNSNFVHNRNTKVLYYDCTNYYFEIEEEKDDKQYGKCKENRPNPIVGMGLFMDADGIPLAFDIYPGNQNEQLSLTPLETRVIKDFDCDDFIYCSDSGLGSKKNKMLNNFGSRHYVITQSLKKLKKENKDIALNPKGYRKLGSDTPIDLTTLDENDADVFNSIYYKEIPLDSKGLSETMIVTYSLKYKNYQRRIRNRQISRAESMIKNETKIKNKRNNPNSPLRFIEEISSTDNGEVAENKSYHINQDTIDNEAQYDGFYAVVTNLDIKTTDIIKINSRRWEIEECFRIMKTEFEARPVYLQRQDRIKAHFLTCFISLLVYRLLENKLDNKYTVENIIDTLRKMNVTKLKESYGYIPSYKRTDLTDDLHKIFGFNTDYEIISRSKMRSIIKYTKEK